MKPRNKRRADLLFIFALIGALVSGGTLIWRAAQGYEPHVPRQPTYQRPPLHDCPRDVDTWTCIKDALYRKDV